MQRIAIVGMTAVVLLCLSALAAKAAASCAQMNDRVFGADGLGGDAARFRALKAKIDQAGGQTQAAAKDRVEYARLAKSILANAKVMRAGNCTVHIVPQANNGGVAQGNTSATRSAHGCVGFNGLWQTGTGTLRINNGAGALGRTSFRGQVNGNVYSGSWADLQMGRGTFIFTLTPGGDSINGNLTNANGARGAYTALCIGAPGG